VLDRTHLRSFTDRAQRVLVTRANSATIRRQVALVPLHQPCRPARPGAPSTRLTLPALGRLPRGRGGSANCSCCSASGPSDTAAPKVVVMPAYKAGRTLPPDPRAEVLVHIPSPETVPLTPLRQPARQLHPRPLTPRRGRGGRELGEDGKSSVRPRGRPVRAARRASAGPSRRMAALAWRWQVRATVSRRA